MFSDRRKRDGYLNNNNNNNKSSYGRGGGGGGGSMVVLSRPRSSQNAGQKLSVPPPLNLPSLRKEHERVDSSGSSFLSGGGVSGSGARPASSGMGWSKPAAAAGEGKLDEPLIRAAVEKVSTLRGEDFPSLKASLPSASSSSVSDQQKHHNKDGLIQNQKQKREEEFPKETTRGVLGVMGSSSLVDVRPQNRFGNEEFSERPSQQVKKKDYLLPGALPVVRMSPRSDWADDERDTSHSFRDRDYGYSKNEPVVREANAWRVSSPLQNEASNNNNNNNNRGIYGARPNSRGREGLKKSNYVMSGSRENVWNNNSGGAREGPYRQPWNNNNNNSIDNSGNRGAAAYGTDKRPLFIKNDKSHVEDHFGDSGFDVHDPFPVLGAAKKKKEALKQAEFHDPVRESFEAELERVQKMQEEERRRIIEEQERVIELVRTEEEERLRLAREQDEQQSRLEEEAREAAVRSEQERVEAARRAEELRKSKEEEKHKLILEEERRKQAAKQKLLELEEKISRRQAEAAKGCSNSSTVSEDVVKEKESSDVDWEDSERMVDRITTSSASRDGSFGFQDRHKPFWRKEDVESGGGNSRFMENVPQRDVGEGFPKEFFGTTTGYIGNNNANSYFKPGFPEHSVDQSWRTPGDGRSYGGRNYGMEQQEPRESFGEQQQQQYGNNNNNPGWGQNQSRGQRRGGAAAYPYPEKLYPNHEEDDYYPFGRPKYSVRQPRVLPPPQESRQKLPFRSEVEHHHPGGPSTSVLASYIGDLQDHHVMSGSGMDDHRFDSKLTGRCDSQSSLSITSTPDSLVHISHDDLDESGNSSVLVSSRKGDGGGLLDAGKDGLMTAAAAATCPVSCWDNEEWTLDNNERLQEQEEYDEDEDGYQEEDKVHGVDENIDLTQELEELHLQEKDSNLVLGFNEGVEVEIHSDDLEKKEAFPLPQHPVGERPSVETSCDEQNAKPVEISDNNASTSFQGTENTMQSSTSYPTVSTHLVAPPYSIGLHQTHVVPSSTSAQQMDERVQFQFGLFSGPSLIPSPYPAIQIGSIQMPLPIDPQFGSSLTHIQQPQSQFIQFGQVRYTSLITQGVLPPPPPQNPPSMATGLLGQGNQVARNAAAPASNPQISVLRRPVDVSDGDKPKNANISQASVEVAVPPPHKQGEFSGKSEPASRKMSHGRSNFADRQSGGGGQVGRNSGGPGEVSRGDAGGYRRYQRQRVEFRVREPNWPSEENRNGNGKAQNSTKSGSRKYVVSKSQKYSSDSSVSGSNSVQKAEGPSDNDDDFIEVRSKRQMLNDRREQREKEIKEKSQASKASRKPRSTLQNSSVGARSNRSPPAGRVANTKQISSVSNRQLLAPIGTPSPKTDSHGDEKAGSSRDVPEQNPASSFVYSNKNNVVENIQTSVGTWTNQLTDQPVMALTQSQLDEAMKPASLLSCVSVENGVNRVSEPNPKPNSVAPPPKNNAFPSPINPLLAESKIQFGAVTSSSVIPPCGENNNSSLYFERDRTPSSSTTGMEICEAEAAASAIAVAAITSDEASGKAGSVTPAETKIYGGTSGTVVAQPSLSKAEESLIVSLPADLSVDTPISLWPPVPSPHNSNQMITHFPQAPPHFPFYDMNPMLRGPIYAFGPHHDSGANQPQSQKGPSGPPTTWQQQGPSGVDSFYAPAGFTGPFLTPPGAMPGVQGPPHMFVYNHFAPVGQFGGLSFMGTTYIPSGKQPDWKHNPMVSSSQVGGDGDANNLNVSPMQCNVVPASLQHMAMPSPLAMFEPSPFQSSSSQEMPVRARWPYMPFPGPPTMQIQNQQEAVDGSPSQFNNNNNMLPPSSNRYPNIQTPTLAADAVDSSNSYGSASQPKPITTLSDPNSNTTQNPANPTFKPPPPPQQQQQSSQEKNTQSQHVGGPSHHNQHQHQHNRRSGFHGRNQAVTRERGYHNNTKVKQIYVAKQSSSNSNNAAASASSTTTTSPSI